MRLWQHDHCLKHFVSHTSLPPPLCPSVAGSWLVLRSQSRDPTYQLTPPTSQLTPPTSDPELSPGQGSAHGLLSVSDWCEAADDWGRYVNHQRLAHAHCFPTYPFDNPVTMDPFQWGSKVSTNWSNIYMETCMLLCFHVHITWKHTCFSVNMYMKAQ